MEISRQKTLFGTGLFHILHQKKKEKEFSPTDSVFCIMYTKCKQMYELLPHHY